MPLPDRGGTRAGGAIGRGGGAGACRGEGGGVGGHKHGRLVPASSFRGIVVRKAGTASDARYSN